MNESARSEARLFSPSRLRGLRLKNRIVVARMCRYSAENGITNHWHFAQPAKFAVGGAGLVRRARTMARAGGC